MCPKINSLCGLINNISMQYDFLSSLVMSLCESVPVWQLEKLQPHSCKEGCYGNVDLISGLRCCVIWMDQHLCNQPSFSRLFFMWSTYHLCFTSHAFVWINTCSLSFHEGHASREEELDFSPSKHEQF